MLLSWLEGKLPLLMTNPTLPFVNLNLRFNPFRELTHQEKSSLSVVKIENFVKRLASSCFALQFLGKKGRGKTTHLLALQKYFPDAPYIYYPENGPKPKIGKFPLLFLDETQRFKPKERMRIWQRKTTFVVGTHKDHSEEFAKAGLEYESIILEGLSEAKLANIIKLRLEHARRSKGNIPYLDESAIKKLIERFDDNIRSIEDYLYEVFQDLETISHVKV